MAGKPGTVRVWLNDIEVGFLSFDIFWEDQLNMYEVFVAQDFREQGIGTPMIQFAIELAREMNKTRLTARPEPLSKQSKDELVDWYMRRGFRPSLEDPELLFRSV